jgi:hypothetical protein
VVVERRQTLVAPQARKAAVQMLAEVALQAVPLVAALQAVVELLVVRPVPPVVEVLPAEQRAGARVPAEQAALPEARVLQAAGAAA